MHQLTKFTSLLLSISIVVPLPSLGEQASVKLPHQQTPYGSTLTNQRGIQSLIESLVLPKNKNECMNPMNNPNPTGDLLVISHVSFVHHLLGNSDMILRPVPRTCSVLVARLLALVKNVLEVAGEDFSKDFVGVETIGTIGELLFECCVEIASLGPCWNLTEDESRKENM